MSTFKDYVYDAQALSWDEVMDAPGSETKIMRIMAKVLTSEEPLNNRARGAIGAYLHCLDGAIRRSGGYHGR